MAFSFQSKEYAEVFNQSREELNTNFGLINTILLLTSGFFMAQAIQYLKLGNEKKSQQLVWFTILFGIGFLPVFILYLY